jgi:serine/threonine protein kinase
MVEGYTILRELGSGGMAVVYLARQAETNRLTAVKILKDHSLADPEYIKRFFREARLTAQLNHPNIISIIESNYTGDLCYIVTEYVDGGDFRRFLKDRGIPLRSKLEIIRKVVDALDHAHQQGIVHRDIKPSNILLTKEGEPKLCDFGIATALWGQESRLTRTNETIGTMDYIAPEQKESSARVDFRADIYSVGVILYQAAAGTKPRGAFPPPDKINPSIPKRLNDCVMKCLQPWPIKRYKNTRNLYLELESILVHMEKPSPAAPAVKPLSLEKAETLAADAVDKPDTEDSTIIDRKSPGFDVIVDTLRNGTLARRLKYKSLLLEKIDKNYEEELIRLLSESDGFLKETVIEALGKLKSEKSCPYLIELLSDPYYNKAAAVAVGEIGCKEAEYKLFNILISNSANAYIALLPLGKLNSVKSVKEMARFLKSPHDWIREMALDALAKITGENTQIAGYVEDVSRKDKNAHIRARAKKLLWRYKKQ